MLEFPRYSQRPFARGAVRPCKRRSIQDKDESPNLFDVIPVIERIWLRDRSLGRELPWTALSNTDVRATIVRNLAQQVRLGRSKLPLKDFQSFAVKLSREDVPLGASEGINLIGFTHAPGQVGFCKRCWRPRPILANGP